MSDNYIIEEDVHDYLQIKWDCLAAKSFAQKALDKDTWTAAMNASEEGKLSF